MTAPEILAPERSKQKGEYVSMCTDIDPHLFYAATYGGHKLVNKLPLTKENPDGNHIDRSSRFVFARRRRLGIFPLAQELTRSWRH
jgi:hypothetical protein